MTFNSLQYAAFFVVVFGVHWALRGRARTGFLLLASYAFYGAWDWRFLSLLVVSSVIDFVAGARIHAADERRRRDRWLALSIVANLGILGFFKYWDFFTDSAADVLEAFGLDWAAPSLEIVLPVGISFYTFQSMSYAIDIHRRRLEPCRSLLDYATFVSFFPQLVAGPIERASHLLPQIEAERRFPGVDDLVTGLTLIGAGLFRKVVIADTLAPLVAEGHARGASGGAALLATYGFALQIYGDFAGYTAIARGSARLLGIDLMVNFDAPYGARDPSDYWRRWHISLSTWLRDYLYIPLGGNRRSQRRTYLNLAVVMLLGGLWHGAAWTFVVWGVLHGLYLILHRWRSTRSGARQLPAAFGVFAMFHASCFAFIFFRAETLTGAGRVISAIASDPLGGLDSGDLLLVLGAASLTFALDRVVRRDGDEAGLVRSGAVLQGSMLAALVVGLVVFSGGTPVPFVYFQF
ncbi:MAG: MBOAT family O-acyltransferase [Acidimicrobiales bacterium]|nr:MBOAT family O-acyltransferase [Acidimicrobiales bacterium]